MQGMFSESLHLFEVRMISMLFKTMRGFDLKATSKWFCLQLHIVNLLNLVYDQPLMEITSVSNYGEYKDQEFHVPTVSEWTLQDLS